MADERDMQPGDCFARVVQLAAEVELIRKEMGRPAEQRPAFVVTGAQPRECYFAALALFRKADHLCFEQTGDDLEELPEAPPVGQLRPGHVLGVLDAALREIMQVKRHLRIPELVREPAHEASRTPSDVFQAIVDASRQVNLLLAKPLSPSDVHAELALATGYVTRLLARHDARATPAPFERHKRPADCYARLLAVLGRLRPIMTRAGHGMLELPAAAPPADIVPSDVHDLAALVLSEVAFLHAQLGDAAAPQAFHAHHPRRRLPAHVYQMAATLEGALTTLASKLPKSN